MHAICIVPAMTLYNCKKIKINRLTNYVLSYWGAGSLSFTDKERHCKTLQEYQME